jgi:hypothetical protein
MTCLFLFFTSSLAFAQTVNEKLAADQPASAFRENDLKQDEAVSEKDAAAQKELPVQSHFSFQVIEKAPDKNTSKEKKEAVVEEEVRDDLPKKAPPEPVEKPYEFPKEKIISPCKLEPYIGLRVLAKGEVLEEGSRKIDPAKLPAGTRLINYNEPLDGDRSNQTRMNLIIDFRNIVASGFCG